MGLPGLHKQPPLPNSSYRIWFNSDTRGIASYSGGLVSTTNGGTTWNTLPSLGVGGLFGVTGYGNKWFYTRENKIYSSDDDGATWDTVYVTTTGGYFHILKARDGSDVVWAVTTGGGITKGTNVGLPVELTSFFSSALFSLNQNYPNPFNPITKINFSVPSTVFIKLKVFDVLGNEIAILVNEEILSGNYEVEFDASNLPSGIYLYKLQAGSFVQTKKMLLLK